MGAQPHPSYPEGAAHAEVLPAGDRFALHDRPLFLLPRGPMRNHSEQIDSVIDIVTPENIAFQYEVAGPFRRLPAYLIDFGLRAMVVVALFIIFMFVGFADGMLVPVLILTVFVLEWFYGGLFETFWNGQTPGKRLLGLRVLQVDGQPIDGMQAVIRNILRFADLMPLLPPDAIGFSMPTGILGLVTSLLNRRYQRLGDLVCGTMVVVERSEWLLRPAKVDDPRAAQLAEYLPANFVVDRSLARALATYVERRKFFSTARRREIARHLGEPLLELFNLPRDTSHDLLLCALYYQTFVFEQRDDASGTEAPFGPPVVPGTVSGTAAEPWKSPQAAAGAEAPIIIE